jgi:hypothetical protein
MALGSTGQANPIDYGLMDFFDVALYVLAEHGDGVKAGFGSLLDIILQVSW